MREIKVCLLWHNLNSNNYGVGALAISHIALLLKAAKEIGVTLKFETVGTRYMKGLSVVEEVERYFGTTVPHVDYSLRDLVRALRRLDFRMVTMFGKYDIVFDIGEGDSFTDLYGPRRFTAQICTKLFTLMAGKPLVLSPQTIGPFKSGIARFFAKRAVRGARSVFTRDEASAGLAKALGAAPTTLTDVAFSLPYEKQAIKNGTVGINISGLLCGGGYTGANQFGLAVNYEDLIERLVTFFRAEGATVHLVPHVIAPDNPQEDDCRACETIKQRFADDPGVLVAPAFRTPMEAKSYISGLEFFLGSRMHATIAALSSGVATVPIAYSKKFASLFEGVAYPITLDARTSTGDEIFDETSRLYRESRVELAAKAQAAKAVALEKLDLYVAGLKDELAHA